MSKSAHHLTPTRKRFSLYRQKSTQATALTSSLILILSAPAFAQSQGLDEIIVTAQKRQESLQDVPIAVTTVNQAYLESRNINSIKSLSSIAPNLKVENTPGNTTAAQISIRGGVTINPALTWEPTVGIYLNGSYIGKTQGSIFDVADIERVEVLRGPQGTLYGRNTLAGAVNLITAKPTEEFGGSAKVGFGNYGQKMAKGSVNFGEFGPFRAKVSGMLEKRDGFVEGVDNPHPEVTLAGPLSSDEYENVDRKSFLIALSADLGENATLDYTFDWSDADQKPSFSQIISVSDNNIFDPSFAGYVGGGPFGGLYFGFPLDLYVNSERQYTGTTDGEVFEKSKVQGHNLTASLSSGVGELKSITSLRKMTWDDALDLDGSPLPLAHTQRLSDYDSFSQEFQLVGDYANFDYVLGAYYFQDEGETKNPQSYFGGANRFDSRYGFETDAYAVYGQLDYAFNERLNLSGGLRWTQEEKSIDRLNILLGDPDITLVPQTEASKTFANVSPMVTLDYAINDHVNVYGKYAAGFKSGGFNGEAGSVAETTRFYFPEKVNSFEFGLKSRLFDNRAQINAAAFFNTHDDMQLSVFTAEGAAASDIRNAAKAKINGFELEALFQVHERFLARGAFGYLSPKYKEFIEFGMDVSDDRAFPHAPKTTFSAGFDWRIYEGDWANLDMTADINNSAKYYTFPYSLTTTTGQNAHNTEAPARTTIDGRIALSNIAFTGNDIQIAIWGKNIFDEEYLTNFIDFGPGFGGLTNGYYGQPATYGITLGLDF